MQLSLRQFGRNVIRHLLLLIGWLSLTLDPCFTHELVPLHSHLLQSLLLLLGHQLGLAAWSRPWIVGGYHRLAVVADDEIGVVVVPLLSQFAKQIRILSQLLAELYRIVFFFLNYYLLLQRVLDVIY